VGKTSILSRCKDISYRNSSNPTVGLDLIVLKFVIYAEEVKLMIWDTAGQERYQSINRSYFKHSAGAIMVVSA
jgi:small GTP-binding protein